MSKHENTVTGTLGQALEIMTERKPGYGHFPDSMEHAAKIFNAITGGDIKGEHVALMQVCVKLARQKNKHKTDNLVDAINYIAVINELNDRSSV